MAYVYCLKEEFVWAKIQNYYCTVTGTALAITKELKNKTLGKYCMHWYVVLGNHVIFDCGFPA